MGFGNFAKGALTVPALTAGTAVGIDALTGSPIGEAIGQTIGAVDTALVVGNSFLNPLFASIGGGAAAGLLTNSILKENKWMEEHNKTRWLLNGVAGVAGFAGGTVAAPYLAVGGLSYAIGRHGWKYGAEALKRGGGAIWGATGGIVKGAVAGGFNSVKAGLKGEQKWNPVI